MRCVWHCLTEYVSVCFLYIFIFREPFFGKTTVVCCKWGWIYIELHRRSILTFYILCIHAIYYTQFLNSLYTRTIYKYYTQYIHIGHIIRCIVLRGRRRWLDYMVNHKKRRQTQSYHLPTLGSTAIKDSCFVSPIFASRCSFTMYPG